MKVPVGHRMFLKKDLTRCESHTAIMYVLVACSTFLLIIVKKYIMFYVPPAVNNDVSFEVQFFLYNL